MREIRKSKQSKHLFPAQNKQIFGYSRYLPLLAKITVVRLYMKEQNTQKHILLIRWTRRRCEYMCKYFYICSGLRFNTDTKFETDIL